MKKKFTNWKKREVVTAGIYCLLLSFLSWTSLFGLTNISQAQTTTTTTNTSTTTTTDSSGLTAEEKAAVEKKVDKIEDKIENKQDDLEDLEQKARNYQRMIDLKKQQQATLKNQLELMDLQTDNIANNIEITKKDIENNTQEINKLQAFIDQKQEEMKKVKEDLAEMIRNFNQIDQEISMEMLSAKGDISVFLNHSEYLDQTSQKVGQVLSQVETKKNELEAQQENFEQKNSELKGKKNQLDEKVYYLNNEKESKDLVLKQTAGEEAKYKELLERVEQQKQELIGDIDALSDDKQAELAKIKSEADKPSTGLASGSWYYSQKDSSWGSNRIGLSSSLIKDYGCALTSVAMVFSFHGQSITPGKMARQPIFYRDLIVWPQYWQGLSISADGHAHGNINWSTVDKQLQAKNPVIVFVRASGGKGHYVVVHSKDKKGKYVVHDPLFGANLYLDTTKKLVGAIYNSSTTVDQMIIYQKK